MATSGTSEGKPNHNIAAEAERHYGEQYHLKRSAKKDVMSDGDADAKAAWREVRQLTQGRRLSTADLNEESLIESGDQAEEASPFLVGTLSPAVCASPNPAKPRLRMSSWSSADTLYL